MAESYVRCRVLCLMQDGLLFDAVLQDAENMEGVLVDSLHVSQTGEWIPFPEEGKEYAELVDANGKKFAIVRWGDQVQ